MCSINVVLCSITSNTYSLHMIIQRWNINPSSFLHFMRWLWSFFMLSPAVPLHSVVLFYLSDTCWACFSLYFRTLAACDGLVCRILLAVISRSLRLDKILILAQHTHHLTILNFPQRIWHLMVFQLLQCPSFRLFKVDLINVLLGGVVTSL